LAEQIDPYRELGLAPEAAAEPELVRAAFKALAKKYHPDAHPDVEGKARAEEKMRRLNEAQRMILSGEYRPPLPELPNAIIAPPSSSVGRTPAASQAGSGKKQAARSVSLAPVYAAGLLLLLCLAAPAWFGRDHLAEAGKLEEKGQLAQALEEANQAVIDDPRDGRAYLLRARLWQKMGEPDRAKIDLANSRTLVGKSDYEQARQELFPTPSISPSPASSPKGAR
jgi:tetratricopeptide (TPR) repeat protein